MNQVMSCEQIDAQTRYLSTSVRMTAPSVIVVRHSWVEAVAGDWQVKPLVKARYPKPAKAYVPSGTEYMMTP